MTMSEYTKKQACTFYVAPNGSIYSAGYTDQAYTTQREDRTIHNGRFPVERIEGIWCWSQVRYRPFQIKRLEAYNRLMLFTEKFDIFKVGDRVRALYDIQDRTITDQYWCERKQQYEYELDNKNWVFEDILIFVEKEQQGEIK